MAGTAVRRGLPRVPGGEPWPPAGAVPGLRSTATVSPDAARGHDEPVHPSAAPAPTGLRRGLPRVVGGEPWPPAGAAAAAAAAPPAPPISPTVPHAAPPSAQTAAPAEERDIPQPRSAPAPGAEAIRRGLPRVRGGDPWPPAGSAPAAAAPAPVVSAPAVSAPAVPAPVLPAPVLPAPVLPAPEPAVPAPVLPVVADPAVVVPAVAEPAVRTPVAARPTAAVQQPTADAPTMRPVTPRQWIASGVLVALAIVGAATIVVAIARWFVGLEPVAAFLQQYSGTGALPEGAPVGLPPWLNWAHFFNALLIVLIIRSGLQVRYERKPDAYWTPKRGGPKTSLSVWLHTSLDVLWIANGLVFVVLLFATGQWMRIVPTSLDVVPHAISAALQYASLDWPTEHGWVHYNALQQLAYFVTVFVAAPLAIITGLRMSRWWPQRAAGLTRAFPIEWARAVHVPVMLYFVAFIVTHVLLVLTTGALRNLNHMYASRDADDWLGFALFAGSLLVIAAAWFAARPSLLVPIAQRFGTVSSR